MTKPNKTLTIALARDEANHYSAADQNVFWTRSWMENTYCIITPFDELFEDKIKL